MKCPICGESVHEIEGCKFCMNCCSETKDEEYIPLPEAVKRFKELMKDA